MPETTKIAVVAALKREIGPLIRRRRSMTRSHDGWCFDFFEGDGIILVCAGIGPEAARRASEAVIALYHPRQILSVGFAGALGTLRVGDIVIPKIVIDMRDGSRFETGSGIGKLVTVPSIAGAGQKAKLAGAYDAIAVDMEAAAVARAAQLHGIPFTVIKAISDAVEFEPPAMDRFIAHRGEFRALSFSIHVAMRPWLWSKTIKLAGNSAKASRALCKQLDQYLQDEGKMQKPAPGSHPIERLRAK